MGQIDDKKIMAYKNRAYAYARRLTRNNEDAEDIATLAIIDMLERKRRHGKQKSYDFEFSIKEAFRLHFGRRDSGKSMQLGAEKRALRINPEANDGTDARGTIKEEHFGTFEPFADETKCQVDLGLMLRCNPEFLDNKSGREQAASTGLTESRVSQVNKAKSSVDVSAYLWEHYKEHGIESELEVDWISI